MASYRQGMEMEHAGAYLEAKKKQLPDSHVLQNSLKQEIQQLQEQLQSQFVIRHALEKAINFQPPSLDSATESSIPKAAMELIKQIAVLELEVVYLEKYLLSLYRRTFKQQVSSSSTMDDRLESYSGPLFVIEGEHKHSFIHSDHIVSPQTSFGNQSKGRNEVEEPEKLSHLHRSYSSLLRRSPGSSTNYPLSKSVAKAVDSYHSLPLSMLESDASNSMSLGEHFGAHVPERAPKSPNWISEEMIKSISLIYCELAQPPLMNNHNNPSPISPLSSMCELSSQDHLGSMRNYEKSFNSNFGNPFHIEEFSVPYCTMLKVQWISRERKKDSDINHMLQGFRSLIYRLKEVDLKAMKHEEKLAFWINVHNTLVMHAYLQYGIPKNSLKRTSLILKAAYNVGGHIISVDMIQSSILGCHLPRSGQWLHLFLSSKTKFKVNDARKSFAINHPEPRLYFALCCGSHSDPAVRIYTAKRVNEELEVAKEDYILSNLRTHKGQRILLPKLVESFAKDSGLCLEDLEDIVEHLRPKGRINDIQQQQQKKMWKSIERIPHNFTFTYLLSKELACQSSLS
ncbi:uncharacterized protein LOC111007555 isoform X2 [Momordica charantia]|uniref:Uncharacterized protein LOC111007555 isoform X2 n=1 Tax=Momordica charantia TaxID=3673 RepID=A0A6J1C220_MOMCH|nr:uncharacterized protein LOC111007555 isoform X2 [Momordica charantia]